MQTVLAVEPQSIGGVLDQGVRLARGGFRAVLGLTLFATLLIGIVQLAQVAQDLGARGAYALPSWAVPVLLLTVLAAYVVYFGAMAAITQRLAAVGGGAPATAGLRDGLRRLPAVLGSSLLLVLAVGVAFVPLGVAVALAWPASPVVVVVTGLVSLCAALYVALRLSMAWIDAMVRRSGPIAALRNSWRLTDGRFWRVSVLFTIVFVIVVVLYVVPAVLVGVVAAFSGGDPVGLMLATVAVVLVVGVLATPYTAAACLAIWHDLRLRGEGTDLSARIDALPDGA